jgi:hypothetical protein
MGDVRRFVGVREGEVGLPANAPPRFRVGREVARFNRLSSSLVAGRLAWLKLRVSLPNVTPSATATCQGTESGDATGSPRVISASLLATA